MNLNLGPLRIVGKRTLESICRKERSEATYVAHKQITLLLEENYHLRNLVNSDKHLQKLLRKKK